MQSVQMHQALPGGLTYSSTHRSRQPGYGVGCGGGGIHSLVPAFDFGRGVCVCVSGVWFWWGLAPFQARVTRALSALWGWGPVAMDTDKSTDRNM